MTEPYHKILKSAAIEASAPCRIDMGGTLDIKTFHLPLRRMSPCTVNIAIRLRTRVRISPWHAGQIKISSAGFDSITLQSNVLSFNNPLGLMFAIADYFGVSGIHIQIESASPPRSALGGSSAAGVALVAALSALFEKTGVKPLTRRQIVWTAHAIEESVAGVPCGLQDQLAAVYGGVNAWYWKDALSPGGFYRKSLVRKSECSDFARHILAAYSGVPHESKNINGRWVEQFLAGYTRQLWEGIVIDSRRFADAIVSRQYRVAGNIMNTETAARKQMTPDVLNAAGKRLVQAAKARNCGARFTGAGGGGCIWAMGDSNDIDRLREDWRKMVAEIPEGCLLDADIDTDGLQVTSL